MPGMDGYQTTIAIRKLGFTGPIVAVTAMSPVEEAEKVKQSGMNHIVSKVAHISGALCDFWASLTSSSLSCAAGESQRPGPDHCSLCSRHKDLTELL
jgi:hypothetical protein